MAKKQNYAKMYPKETESKVEPVVDDIVEEVECGACAINFDEPVEETTDKTLPMFGIVSGCKRLNIRTNPNPNSDVVYVANENNELHIDPEKSTFDWWHVRNAAGIEGYCMKAYIEIKE